MCTPTPPENPARNTRVSKHITAFVYGCPYLTQIIICSIYRNNKAQIHVQNCMTFPYKNSIHFDNVFLFSGRRDQS